MEHVLGEVPGFTPLLLQVLQPAWDINTRNRGQHTSHVHVDAPHNWHGRPCCATMPRKRTPLRLLMLAQLLFLRSDPMTADYNPPVK
jgi:hypothetical protein